jgi:sec-independent protein translocase protein TatA
MIEGLFQPMHLVLIVGVVLLFLGPRKLPELGKGLGQGIRALKEGLRDAPAPPPTAGPSGGPSQNP